MLRNVDPSPYRTTSTWVLGSGWIDDVMATPCEKSSRVGE
ncbi:Uncharacterised protein [Mycobacteroides abscessus subsp. abscessus]|nr:Uncharacterised protein [Mycobacteroides abscessus subsp. abscessus]